MYLDQAGMALLQLMEARRVDVVLLQSAALAQLQRSSPQHLPAPIPHPWEGAAAARWGLQPCGIVVIHLFKIDGRDFHYSPYIPDFPSGGSSSSGSSSSSSGSSSSSSSGGGGGGGGSPSGGGSAARPRPRRVRHHRHLRRLATLRTNLRDAAWWEVRAAGLVLHQFVDNPVAFEGGRMFDAFVEAFVQASSAMRLVFHGTAAANVDAICADGLDPTFRKFQRYGEGEYFAEDPLMAVPYGGGGHGRGECGIIVFVVLITEDTVHNANGIVVVDQTTHQLPLGVAHFHFDQAAAATAVPQGVTSSGRQPHDLFVAGQRYIAADFARQQRSSSGGGGGGGGACTASSGGGGGGRPQMYPWPRSSPRPPCPTCKSIVGCGCSSSSSSSSGGGGGGGGGATAPCPTCKSIVGCGCSSSSSSSSRPTKKRRLSLTPAASPK